MKVETTELNVVGKIIGFLLYSMLFFGFSMGGPVWCVFGPIMLVVALVSAYDKGEADMTAIFVFIVLSVVGFIFMWLVNNDVDERIDNWLKKHFGYKVMTEIPDSMRSNQTYSQHNSTYKSNVSHSSNTNYSKYEYKKRSSSSSYSGGSSSGGGSSFGGTSTYVPANDINKALKDFETNGKDVNALVNNVSDEEREKLFSKYFKDEDKGQYANDKFNRDIAWPARKQTLEKILNEAEYEDDETKDNLSEKINNLGEEISNEDFQATAKEIRTFQERKRAKDNHIKYEGRLSNKDIQAIKEYHGYVCMGCGLDPVEEYGEQMKGILEAHHKIPWAEIKENEVRTVEPNDFYILCPNCHRMIHKLKSPDDLDGLKEVLNQNKKSHWWD